MRCSRHCTSTWTVTSSGMRSSSAMRRMKSKSVREPDLDLLEADLEEDVEERHLAVGVHRVDERLVAVTEVDAAPARRLRERAVGPGAIRQAQRKGRPVALEGHRRDAAVPRSARLVPAR